LGRSENVLAWSGSTDRTLSQQGSPVDGCRHATTRQPSPANRGCGTYASWVRRRTIYDDHRSFSSGPRRRPLSRAPSLSRPTVHADCDADSWAPVAASDPSHSSSLASTLKRRWTKRPPTNREARIEAA
jgi:hypothetical protein